MSKIEQLESELQLLVEKIYERMQSTPASYASFARITHCCDSAPLVLDIYTAPSKSIATSAAVNSVTLTTGTAYMLDLGSWLDNAARNAVAEVAVKYWPDAFISIYSKDGLGAWVLVLGLWPTRASS